MDFLSDYTAVKFAGFEKAIDVYATLVEFNIPFIGTHISIKFYGVIIAIGFLLAVIFGGRMAYKWKLDLNKMLDVLLFGTIAGIIGARLYYVAFEWDYYSQHLAEIPQIWNGGIAIYGGILGGAIAAYFTCKHNGLNFMKLLDIASMSLLIGQGIGRWGNFTNQEAFGINTTMPWGMSSAKISNYISDNQEKFLAGGISVDADLPVHPTFLYESLWCLIGFVIIYFISKKFYKFSGQLILSYGIIYGLERAIVEGLRTDSLYIGTTSIRVSQVLSLIIVLLCVALMIAKSIELKKHPMVYDPVEILPPEDDYVIPVKEEKKNKTIAKKKLAKDKMNERIRKREK